MGRSSNDDRSDTMNPNNAAYWTDQENRFGHEDDPCTDDDDPSEPSSRQPSAPHPLDALADRDLGDPQRYRDIDLARLRWDFEQALATPASEERDRLAATAELLRMAAAILTVARNAAIRQGVGGQLFASLDVVELLLDDGRSMRVCSVDERHIVTISGSQTESFEYAERKWHRLTDEVGHWGGAKTLKRCSDYRAIEPLPCLIGWLRQAAYAPGGSASQADC